MEVSKLTFRPETASQTGSIGKILMWCQDNPRFLKDTNLTQMSKCIGRNTGMNQHTVRIFLNKMVNIEMLTRVGGRRRSDFAINYYQKDIPGYIIDRAPAEERKRILKYKKEMEKYIQNKGGSFTAKRTITKSKPELKAKKPEEVINKSSSDASEENTTSIPVVVRGTERGLSISITLNLNIK